MKKPWPLILVLIFLAAFGTTAWHFLSHRPQPVTGVLYANGTLEATEVDVSSKVAGHLLTLYVEEGEAVEQNQLLATLDGAELQAQVAQAQGAYDSAQARLAELLRGARQEELRQGEATLAQAQAAAAGARRALTTAQESYAKSTELKAQVDAAQTAYDAARDALEQARARRDLVYAGARPEQIQAARAAVAQAEAQALNARAKETRARKLFEAGALAAQELDTAVAARDATGAALAAAQAALRDLQAGARPQEREQAEVAVAQAQTQVDGTRKHLQTAQQLYDDRLTSRAQVETAQTRYDTASRQVENARAALDLLLNGPTPQTIQAARGQVAQARGALQASQERLQYLNLHAPVSGRVLVKNVERGELVVAGRPLLRLADLENMWVRVYVPLTNLRVRLGNRATVTTDAYPEEEFTGVVTEVADRPEFTPKNIQTKEERVKLVFGVKITLNNPQLKLKPGMPADAIIYLSDPGAED
ncbi:MAG: HlyD family efflux transporter periplasmic adaptor subunit [candidate division WS1 bacterium]|nr:HlyD family efflux transporter periplasmic adaptor subunit [candidate division WS1 bacterium]